MISPVAADIFRREVIKNCRTFYHNPWSRQYVTFKTLFWWSCRSLGRAVCRYRNGHRSNPHYRANHTRYPAIHNTNMAIKRNLKTRETRTPLYVNVDFWHQLTTYCKVRLEEPTGKPLIWKLPTFYGTRNFTSMRSTASHWRPPTPIATNQHTQPNSLSK